MFTSNVRVRPLWPDYSQVPPAHRPILEKLSTVWNVERGEASIPSKGAALMILEGLVGDSAAERSQIDRPVVLGDRLAARARKKIQRKEEDNE